MWEKLVDDLKYIRSAHLPWLHPSADEAMHSQVLPSLAKH